MKPVSLLFFMVVLSFAANSQQRTLDFRDTSQLGVKSRWQLIDGKLQLEPARLEKKDTILLELKSQDGDVWIDYQLPGVRKNRSYFVEVILSEPGKSEPLKLLPNYFSGDLGLISQNKNARKRIAWTDVLDKYEVEPGSELSVDFSVKIIESAPWKLRKIPEFTLRQTWPHYAGFLAGGGLLAAGVLLKNDADDLYNDRYQTQFFESPAEPFYQQANDKRRQSVYMMYAGGSLLAINAVWFTTRWIIYKGNQRVYELYYQKEGLSFQPVIMPDNAGAGFSLAYVF